MSIAQSASPVRREPDTSGAGGSTPPWLAQSRAVAAYFMQPVSFFRTYDLGNLRADVMAALTLAIVMLPQAIAFALVAELPPHVGLYAAIIGSVVGALWGSSSQLQTGPTNTTSLLVFSVLLTVATPGTPNYLVAAGIMAFLVGIVRLVMGLARLGMLVNFVSDSVIVGFTAGAGTLIFVNQLRHLLRLPFSSMPSLWQTLPAVITHLADTHGSSALIGASTIGLIVVLRKVSRKLPELLIVMVAASVAVAVLGLDARGVRIVGELPRGLPPYSPLPLLDFDQIVRLLPGSMAVAAIGLVEAMSIARSIASKTGQRLDSSQEFVGQGLANLACAFFSGYTCSGSFTRSAVNYEAGAKTALSSVLSGITVLIMMLLLAPLAAYVPLSALAGVLILTAWRLIDVKAMVHIWQSSSGDRLIMVVTVLATLALPLQFAVLTGIVLSLLTYLVRTSTPRVRTVLPEDDFRHFSPRPDKPCCPQLGIIEILGDLYFGAVNHIEEYIHGNATRNPGQRYLLLRLQTVEQCDISGIHTLESIVRSYRERGGNVYLVRVRVPVLGLMESSGFLDLLGEDHVLDQDDAIGHLFHRVIDPAVCIYECPVRAFKECQNLPKQSYPGELGLDVEIAPQSVPNVSAEALWDELRGTAPPQVIDVREPREFKRAHIAEARSIPLPVLLNHTDEIVHDRPVVMVCRSGRRSARAIALLQERGYDDSVRVLRGGMIAWEDANLLEAVERYGGTDHVGTPIA